MEQFDVKNHPTTRHSLKALSVILLAGFALSACSDNDKAPVVVTPPPPPPVVMQTFSVTVTNLTANQPLSPIALVAHDAQTVLWQAGTMASVALEKLAEGGDSADIDGLTGVSQVVKGAGAIMPGMSETVTVRMAASVAANLSLASMLVNTNDAFTGFTGMTLADLVLNQASSMRYHAYDAGTEANSEAKGTMPGPADGGEGYNSARDDVDFVHIHPGVISMDDGLADSVLTPSHRFDNPVVAISVMRSE
jgi:hypothetical protein